MPGLFVLLAELVVVPRGRFFAKWLGGRLEVREVGIVRNVLHRGCWLRVLTEKKRLLAKRFEFEAMC